MVFDGHLFAMKILTSSKQEIYVIIDINTFYLYKYNIKAKYNLIIAEFPFRETGEPKRAKGHTG